MNYFDFIQLIVDAENEEHMQVNMVDKGFKPSAGNNN